MSNFANDGYELGWDAEIKNEGTPFVVAENGDYDFTVVGFERGRFAGSAKMPPCNQAKLTIRLDIPGESGVCDVKHNLFLHSKTEWKISEFFISIGQKKKGESIVPNWNMILGAKGRCKVSKRSFKNKDDKEMWTNDIDKFYEPASNVAPSGGLPFRTDNLPQGGQSSGGGYTPGMF
jgi:hypothetical protein